MKLEDIRKLCDAATPGPWVWHHAYPDGDRRDYSTLQSGVARVLDDGSACGEYNKEIDPHGDDAAFIAASRTLLPKLVAVAEAARAVTDYKLRDGYDFHEALVVLAEALTALEVD